VGSAGLKVIKVGQIKEDVAGGECSTYGTDNEGIIMFGQNT
jgi:hypothetical protein